jgi:cellulose synthase/poly-beta-1,6-N-acetylglucosamine synthase-like glycosyltransferase
MNLSEINKRHLAFLGILLIILFHLYRSTSMSYVPCQGKRAPPITTDELEDNGNNNTHRARFVNLNDLHATAHAKQRQEHVLILTPLKNAEPYLKRYFELIDDMTYPKHLITVAFLVSDTTDNTVKVIRRKADELLNKKGYHAIRIYEKDFQFQLPEDKRHQFQLQPLRRSYMARSRNYLLTAALRNHHSWVLWLDADVIHYPPTILEDLQSLNVDVVVPNCLRETEDGTFWGYDKNNWQETPQSKQLQENLDPVKS